VSLESEADPEFWPNMNAGMDTDGIPLGGGDPNDAPLEALALLDMDELVLDDEAVVVGEPLLDEEPVLDGRPAPDSADVAVFDPETDPEPRFDSCGGGLVASVVVTDPPAVLSSGKGC
jgi:hypothetical protein